ncbi:MAG: nucleotidyltransferase family protein, partial [Geminicoccaceae bacterium]
MTLERVDNGEDHHGSLLDLLNSDADFVEMLRAVRALGLSDGWITAGAIRNRVWDHLHHYDEPTALNDVDVIYLDPDNLDEAFEKQQDQALGKRVPGIPWSVKNQARMAERNSDPPYRSIDDALRHWCETPTAVAVRLNGRDEVEIRAPLGLDDLFGLIV